MESVRNVALVGHQGTGKTSLVEAMLYRAGVVGRPGRVDEGSTVGDDDPEERERHQSLTSHVLSFDWDGRRVTVIDTPGYPDFVGDVFQAMEVAELIVFVIDASSGVQAMDLVLWRRAAAANRPRIIFINGLDRAHASFDEALASVHAFFGSHAEPVELPIGEGSSFHGIADLLTDGAFVYDSGRAEDAEVPAEMVQAERKGHERLVEEVIEGDDDILESYLEGMNPSAEQLEALLHDALDAGTVFPVLCGSATVPIGVDHLLDFICHVGPAPGDTGPTTVEAGGRSIEVPVDREAKSLAYVFKTRIDQFLGPVSYLKVLSGTVHADDVLVNSRTRSRERLRQLRSFDTGDLRHVAEVSAGSIAAVAKLENTRTGDTLAAEGAPVVVPGPAMPEGVYGISVRAATPANESRLATGLARLVAEDASLRVSFEPSTRQTVLWGGGETHLRVALARLSRQGVEVETEDVKTAYHETLAGPVEIQARHKKQTGGHGQFAVATVRLEPLDRGAGFVFESHVTGGAIPRNLIPAVGAGIEEALSDGGRYGFPVVDVRAVCLDGQHHPVDSSEMAFKIAGALALRTAVRQVGTTLLEPISKVEIHIPSALQGDVLGDLSARRAQVLGTGTVDTSGTMIEVQALVPTAEIGDYSIALRSMTGGAGSFTRSHHGYQVVPDAVASEIAASNQT